MIDAGSESAVVVLLNDFLRYRALENLASQEAREDAEDLAAIAEWKARDAAGLTTYVPLDEVKRRLGLDQ